MLRNGVGRSNVRGASQRHDWQRVGANLQRLTNLTNCKPSIFLSLLPQRFCGGVMWREGPQETENSLRLRWSSQQTLRLNKETIFVSNLTLLTTSSTISHRQETVFVGEDGKMTVTWIWISAADIGQQLHVEYKEAIPMNLLTILTEFYTWGRGEILQKLFLNRIILCAPPHHHMFSIE